MKTAKPLKALMLGTLLIFVAAIAYAATYQQGYSTGCNLGNTETYYAENQALWLRTLDMALEAQEYDYYAGVLDGYPACRYVPPPLPGRDIGTTCDIYGCTSDGDDPAEP